jgi:hypothetical protein
VVYGGGGGGGIFGSVSPNGTFGTGGSGIGGNGTALLAQGNGGNGATNTGSGGGGAGDAPGGNGGAGGSGVVIISYPSTFADLFSVAGTLTCNGSPGNTTPTISGGNKIYIFTAGTGNISW